MPATTPPTIDAFPPTPDPNDRATFDSRAYTWTISLPTFSTQVFAVATNAYNNASYAADRATAAAGSATDAAASATAAASSASAASGSAAAAAASYSSIQTFISLLPAGALDDSVTSATKTWSSNKINAQITSAVSSASSPTLKRSVRTSNAQLSASDLNTIIDILSGTFTQTFTAAATLGANWYCYIHNSGKGVITLDPNGSEKINGCNSIKVMPGERYLVFSTGSDFVAVKTGSGELKSSQAITTVTTVAVTSSTNAPAIVPLDATRALIIYNKDVSAPQYALRARVVTINGPDDITLGAEYTDTNAQTVMGVRACLIDVNKALVMTNGYLMTISVSGDVVTFNARSAFSYENQAATPIYLSPGVAALVYSNGNDQSVKITVSGTTINVSSAYSYGVALSYAYVEKLSSTKVVFYNTDANSTFRVVDFSGATPTGGGTTVSHNSAAKIICRTSDTSFCLFSTTEDASLGSTLLKFRTFTVSGNSITEVSSERTLWQDFPINFKCVKAFFCSTLSRIVLLGVCQNTGASHLYTLFLDYYPATNGVKFRPQESLMDVLNIDASGSTTMRGIPSASKQANWVCEMTEGKYAVFGPDTSATQYPSIYSFEF